MSSPQSMHATHLETIPPLQQHVASSFLFKGKSLGPQEGSTEVKQCVTTNVFRTGLIIESEKLPIHDSLVEPTIEPWSDRRLNRDQTSDIINI